MRRALPLMLAGVVLLGAAGAVIARLDGAFPPGHHRPVIALDGSGLESGVQGIPPQPTFSVSLDGGRPSDYRVLLDGKDVALESAASGARLKLPPQPQGGWHHLEMWRPGLLGGRDDDIKLDFRIVEPLRLAVGWLGTSNSMRAQVTWSRTPADPGALAAQMRQAGATVSIDGRGASATWSGVNPGQALGFTVPTGYRAVDGGYLPTALSAGMTVPSEAPATAVQVSGAAPVDGRGLKLQLYYVSTPTARADLAQHVRQISVLSPAFYSVDTGGALHARVDAVALSIAQANGVAVMPLVTNTDFDAGMGHQLLSSTALVDQVAAQLVDEAHVRGYSGYQLDFENLAAGDRPALSRFSAALAGKLKTAGLEYSVAVIPRRLTSSPRGPSAVYDYAALYRGAGWLTMMAYDQHTRQEDPGPVAALDWVKEVIGVTSARLDRSRLYLGVPLYARDFSMAAAPASLPYADAVNVTAQNGGSVRWDFDAATARAEYVSAGVQHEVWMDGRASLEAKVGLAREQHFAGVSAWRLGYEDPDFWALWPSR